MKMRYDMESWYWSPTRDSLVASIRVHLSSYGITTFQTLRIVVMGRRHLQRGF